VAKDATTGQDGKLSQPRGNAIATKKSTTALKITQLQLGTTMPLPRKCDCSRGNMQSRRIKCSCSQEEIKTQLLQRGRYWGVEKHHCRICKKLQLHQEQRSCNERYATAIKENMLKKANCQKEKSSFGCVRVHCYSGDAIAVNANKECNKNAIAAKEI
jgi:hypothetical protein